MYIYENKNLKDDEYFYNCEKDIVECKDRSKIENFKVVNISEDRFKNVYLLCRKKDYKEDQGNHSS